MQYLIKAGYSLDLLKPAAASTKPTSKGVTFRLSTEKLEQLRKAADDSNISPNTLFNQILRSYLIGIVWQHVPNYTICQNRS